MRREYIEGLSHPCGGDPLVSVIPFGLPLAHCSAPAGLEAQVLDWTSEPSETMAELAPSHCIFPGGQDEPLRIVLFKG